MKKVMSLLASALWALSAMAACWRKDTKIPDEEVPAQKHYSRVSLIYK